VGIGELVFVMVKEEVKDQDDEAEPVNVVPGPFEVSGS
jgi:hypothetical protein